MTSSKNNRCSNDNKKNKLSKRGKSEVALLSRTCSNQCSRPFRLLSKTPWQGISQNFAKLRWKTLWSLTRIMILSKWCCTKCVHLSTLQFVDSDLCHKRKKASWYPLSSYCIGSLTCDWPWRLKYWSWQGLSLSCLRSMHELGSKYLLRSVRSILVMLMLLQLRSWWLSKP